jgi:hypothetical protein
MVFGLRDDHELIRQRLMLAGYGHEADVDDSRSLWSGPAGRRLLLFEAGSEWARDALSAAMRNRDARGAAHLTLPFLLLTELSRPGDSLAAKRVITNATEDDLHQVRSLLARLPEPLRARVRSALEARAASDANEASE